MSDQTTASPATAASAAPQVGAGQTGSGQAGSEAPDGRSTTFQAVEGGGETRSGSTLMVEAYVVLWLILMTWLVLLWRKQASLNARLDGLERAIDRASAASAKKK